MNNTEYVKITRNIVSGDIKLSELPDTTIEEITKKMEEEILKSPWLFSHYPNELDELKTEEMCLAAVKHDAKLLQYVPKDLLTKEMCVIAIKNDGLMLEYVPEKFKTKNICMEALKSLDVKDYSFEKNYAKILEKIPDKIKDEEFWTTAVNMNKMAFVCIPEIKDLNISSLRSSEPENLKLRFEFNEKTYFIAFKDNDYSISEFQSWDNYREGLHISDFVLYDDLKDDYLVEVFSKILEIKEQYLDQEPDRSDSKEVMTVGEEER